MAKMTNTKVLPTSTKTVKNELVGVKDVGYIDKKGTPSGMEAKFNKLPPGMNIEEQDVRDINAMPMKMITPSGYPGDGWT